MPLPPISPGLLQMFGARSGCSQATPLSTTPTTVDALPRLTSHASGASMSASAVPARPLTTWPVLLRPHRPPNRGSSGCRGAGVVDPVGLGEAYVRALLQRSDRLANGLAALDLHQLRAPREQVPLGVVRRRPTARPPARTRRRRTGSPPRSRRAPRPAPSQRPRATSARSSRPQPALSRAARRLQQSRPWSRPLGSTWPVRRRRRPGCSWRLPNPAPPRFERALSRPRPPAVDHACSPQRPNVRRRARHARS